MVAACGECCCKSSVLGPTACHIGVREPLSEAIASDAQLVCFGLLLLYLPGLRCFCLPLICRCLSPGLLCRRWCCW